MSCCGLTSSRASVASRTNRILSIQPASPLSSELKEATSETDHQPLVIGSVQELSAREPTGMLERERSLADEGPNDLVESPEGESVGDINSES